MQKIYIPFEEVNYLSASDKAYANNDSSLQSFFKYPVELSAFEKIIADKKKDKTDRSTLVEVLKEQYLDVRTSELVKKNIDSLKSENTFTIITAHQPSLFTGPLYFIYKIVSAINLTKELKSTYPDYHFVPVFWLGSEDHDFEEINHLHVFGKSITWQNDENGATGMMSTDTLAAPLAELKAVLGDKEEANHIHRILVDCFQNGHNYAKSTFLFVNELFKQYGLVVATVNHSKLKQLFIPMMEDELLAQNSHRLVGAEIAKKEAKGWKGQAAPRKINLFYMKKGFRERIVLEDGTYKVLNRDITFTREEILEELRQHPEHFSPNVIMRPLYQELIFPNLAYIGGGGELAYWRERMPQFDHFDLNFPMLIRRNSVLWIDKGNAKRLNKLGLSVTAAFEDSDTLVRNYVNENSKEELSIPEAKEAMAKLYENIREKAIKVDITLERAILAEKTKQLKAIDQLESRLIRAEKKKHDTAIKQINTIKERLFPDNGLQERYDNFLPFYLRHGDNFIQILIDELKPLNKNFVVLLEND